MDEDRAKLVEELRRLRDRAEEIGRQLQEMERAERRTRLRLIPGGAAALAAAGLAAVRERPVTAAVASVGLATALLITLPGSTEPPPNYAAPPPPAHSLPPPSTRPPSQPTPDVPQQESTPEDSSVTVLAHDRPDRYPRPPQDDADSVIPPGKPDEDPLDPPPEPEDPEPEPDPEDPEPEPGGDEDPSTALLDIELSLGRLLRVDLEIG